MPERVDHGRHALLLIRVALIGLSEIERGRDGATDEDHKEIRALTTDTILGSVRLLDLYLADDFVPRDDGADVTSLVHHGTPWRCRLSNKAGSVIVLRKPTAEDLRKGRQFVTLDVDGPLDDGVVTRWKKIDGDARPDPDLNPFLDEMLNLTTGRGFGARR